MAHKGTYKPKNIKKYRGDINNIRYLSLWELKSFKWCDNNPRVLKWSSEEIVIPYRCDTDGKMHRYYMDLWVKMDSKSVNGFDELLIEVKPHKQHCQKCFERKACPCGLKNTSYKKRRRTKSFLYEERQWVKNQSKWRATKKWAKAHKMEFFILDEFGLGMKKPRRYLT